MQLKAMAAGWRGVALVAVVYVYFLIFAQFGFLARLAELSIAGDALKWVMAAMAIGGIGLSLLAGRITGWHSAVFRLRSGLALCAIAAAASLAPLTIFTAAADAFLIGSGLGIVTVTVVTHLRHWTGDENPILMVGLGTGIGYFVCNIPTVFTSTPVHQAWLAAALSCIAMAVPFGGARLLSSSALSKLPTDRRPALPFAEALVSFFALIWLDSAAFYIIQHTPTLKAGTWIGQVHLWVNAGLHLAAAIAASIILARRRVRTVLACALGALAFACILLQHSGLIVSASLFYPVGVSLYSVALVAYPSFLSQAESASERGRQAGWIYAIAGWIGSALGIGMGQNLGHVPIAFVAVAGVVVLAPALLLLLRNRPRECALIGTALLVAFAVDRTTGSKARQQLSAVERGKQVYISEGCISCHSQYVRPNSPDVLMWGPPLSMENIRRQTPPLIGNRRQGPDLLQVGARRSSLWLKAHTTDPREVSYHSVMPSYAVLFTDSRGADLVAYLKSLGSGNEAEHVRQTEGWRIAASAWRDASSGDGARVYHQSCATCHDPNGAAFVHWRNEFTVRPPDLSTMRSAAATQTNDQLAHLAKFGKPGTDMPGHEYLSDQQIASVVLWLKVSTPQHPPNP